MKYRIHPRRGFSPSSKLTALAGILGAAAVANGLLARKAERETPPVGRFLTVDGARLHYVERGSGDVLVLLHGDGSMVQDFLSSGLVDLAAERFRVIVFDRPGYGYSERAGKRVLTPGAQADLIAAALRQLGVEEAIVLGHSWGASVAVAIGLRHPALAKALVLASGYYYPSFRLDMLAMSAPAVPIVGDVIRYTLAPMLSRLLWPLMMRKIFGPAPTPSKFAGFPREMALRPWQLRSSAVESAMLIPDAAAFQSRYRELTMPVAVVAGQDDRLVDSKRQSARLHGELPRSVLRLLPGVGHMVHQTATEDVFAAIKVVAASAQLAPTPTLASP